MDGFKEMERMLQNTESKLQKMVWDETNKLRNLTMQFFENRSVLMHALLEELDDEQRERIKARALELSASPDTEKFIISMFNPTDEDEDDD